MYSYYLYNNDEEDGIDYKIMMVRVEVVMVVMVLVEG